MATKRTNFCKKIKSKISKRNSIPIIHGKAELELHDAEVRAEAIDELMEVVKSTYHNFCGFDLERMTKYGNENASQLEQSYSTMMMYEIASEFDDLIDALEQLKAGDKNDG